MADTNADIIQSEGVEVAQSPDALNFSDGLDAVNTNGTVEVGLKDNGVYHKKLIVRQSLTTAANGAFTATINPDSTFVSITSGGATEYAVLPATDADYIGREIKIWSGGTGFELVTPDGSGDTINGADGDGTNQLDVAANTLVTVTQVSATAWMALSVAAGSVTAAAADND